MVQNETATQRNTATGTLPPMFAPAGRVPETVPGGFKSTRASETVFLTELTCEGRTFVFNHPLPVQVVQEDGGWTFESEECRLLAYGHDRLEAESSFRHFFVYCWDDIACEDDERLALGALKQKRALLALVKAQK